MKTQYPFSFGRAGRALHLCAALFLAGCAIGPSRPVELPVLQAGPPVEPGPYRIRAGDELEVRFFHTPEQNTVLPVRPDGMISLPLAYEVRAAGRTVEDLRKELVQRYARELQSPEIAVIVRTFTVDQIHVGGEVGQPGVFDLKGPRTVLQAILEAGGFLPTASPENVLVVRATDTGYRVIPLDLEAVLDGEDASGNLALQAYDVVYVPMSRIASVDKWVDQYIDKVLPINFTFRLDPFVDDDDNN